VVRERRARKQKSQMPIEQIEPTQGFEARETHQVNPKLEGVSGLGEGEALQLVSISHDLKKFEVNQEALEMIRNIEGEIGIVSIAGA
jgi:hypothetical protein